MHVWNVRWWWTFEVFSLHYCKSASACLHIYAGEIIHRSVFHFKMQIHICLGFEIYAKIILQYWYIHSIYWYTYIHLYIYKYQMIYSHNWVLIHLSHSSSKSGIISHEVLKLPFPMGQQHSEASQLLLKFQIIYQFNTGSFLSNQK